jgi:uncharacterized protein YaaN involved in tellurite resistance
MSFTTTGIEISNDRISSAIPVGDTAIPKPANLVKVNIELEQLPPDIRKRVEDVSKTVVLSDSNSISSFASQPQKELTKHLDAMLKNVSTSDFGEAGVLVAELAEGIKGLDFKAMRQELEGGKMGRIRSFLRNLPFIGKHFAHVEKLKVMTDDIQEHLNNIEGKAMAYMTTLKKGTSDLDRLLEVTEDNLRELAIWLRGGGLALEKMRQEIESDIAKLRENQDVLLLTLVRDKVEQLNAFETRLLRLNIAYEQGIQSLPQIRQTQQAARIEYQNTMDTFLTDIPSIKQALVRILNLKNVISASEASEARRRLNRDIGRLSQDMQETAILRAKASQGDFEKDISYLVEMAERQSALGNRTAEMDRIARNARQEAMVRIAGIREKFLVEQRDQIEEAAGIR